MAARITTVACAMFLIAIGMAAPVQSNEANSAVGFETGDTVFVKTGPTELLVGSTDQRLLGAGTPLKIMSIYDNWVQVSVDSNEGAVTGWVSNSSVSLREPAGGAFRERCETRVEGARCSTTR